ncbi:MAG: hypothetical protein JO265_14130 [Acidimicrobiia bacterium]|nr:hypothetical protein [Acidimicrobiia bacterium]
MEPRQDVEVRCRFDGTWVAGFQVTEATEVGGEERYRLLRLSDGVVLPALFGVQDVRPRATRDRVVPMSRRQPQGLAPAPAPVGAGG